MILRSHLFRKVTIVGVGLIGGSLGLAIKKHNLSRQVVGLSHHPSSLDQVMKSKAVDAAMTDTRKAISDADLVVLTAPVESIVKSFAMINPFLKRGCIVTDVGSAKVEIIDTAEKVLSNPGFFVSSHPLAGSEKKGVDFASAELFENSTCIMTPTPKTNQVAKEKIKYLWTKLGAQVRFLSAEDHDQILANISHLPHLLAYGLMETIPQEFLEYASTGLKDTTRIAASPPQIWNDICLANAKNILNALDQFVQHLSHYRKAIIDKDKNSLTDHFTKAKEKRDGVK